LIEISRINIVRPGVLESANFQARLTRLAELTLCDKNHRPGALAQVEEICETWTRRIGDYRNEEPEVKTLPEKGKAQIPGNVSSQVLLA